MAKVSNWSPFSVSGPRNRQFPMDMLRYDMAWPDASLDAHKIEAMVSIHPSTDKTLFLEEDGKTVKINLISTSPQGPNSDRWRSFGWTAVAR